MKVIDDLDGAVLEVFETVRWSLDGRHYEFDTSPGNAGKFRQALSAYREASRTVAAAATSARGTSMATPTRGHSQTIRDWANNSGYTVGGRGRVPRHIVDAYTATH